MPLRFLIFITILILSFPGFSQKLELIEDKDEIVRRATAELDQSMQAPEGLMYVFAKENSLTGEYTFDITIREKGEVATVFVVSSETTNLKAQNMIKDKVKSLKFSFKMPKGKSFKFQYKFNFNF